MGIKHNPQFPIDEIIDYYSAKDGVDVSYVCTTDLQASDTPVDVYYRETPHPEFDNRYFGLYYDHVRDHMMICNADIVETLEFGTVANDEGDLEYSESHHQFKQFDNGNMIDGGRIYIRASGIVFVYVVNNGAFEFVKDMPEFKDDYIYPGTDAQV